jgi:predicted O-methyltransferase YrrM
MLKDTRELEFVDYGSGKLKGENGERRRVCDIAKGSLARRKDAQLLARLVGWLGRPLLTSPSKGGIGDEASDDRKGLTIVELGMSFGVTTAYLAAMDSRNKVVTCEGCPAVAEVARENWGKLGLKNVECRVGEIDVVGLCSDLPRVDVVFMDANHTYEATLRYFDVLASHVHEKTVIVVDDIHYNAEMQKAWQVICADERVTSTMDLYRMGLVFFDSHYWHRNYKMRV